MNYFLTRITSFVLVFGFFFAIFSCTTQQLTVHQAEEEMNAGNYELALSSVNRVLQENPGDQQALLLKADLLYELAKTQERPERRFNYYRDMRQTLDLIPSESSEYSQKKDSLIIHAWNTEQGAGVRLLQQDDSDGLIQNPFPIIAHFENALEVNPDSSSTYSLKSMTYYRNGEVQKAVETLDKARQNLDPFPTELLQKIAFLYLEEGQIEKSIESYSLLHQQKPDDPQITHGLINAYILEDRYEQSVQLLRDLIRNHPENITYHETLATQIFYLFRASVQELRSGEFIEENLESRIETLLQNLSEAEEHFLEVRENQPEPTEITFNIAAFYKNSASHLFTLSEQLEQPFTDTLESRARELLYSSIPLWESVIERNPENPEMWNNLYQVYRKLDMNEEAESVRTRSNI